MGRSDPVVDPAVFPASVPAHIHLVRSDILLAKSDYNPDFALAVVLVAVAVGHILAVDLIVAVEHRHPIAAVVVVAAAVAGPTVAVVAELVVGRRIVDVRVARWDYIVGVGQDCRPRSVMVVGLDRIGTTRGEEVGAVGSHLKARCCSFVVVTCRIAG
jgi:hypothetical protein